MIFSSWPLYLGLGSIARKALAPSSVLNSTKTEPLKRFSSVRRRRTAATSPPCSVKKSSRSNWVLGVSSPKPLT
ncbi:hypothetical protein HYQ46_006166 [Verticillium longisporum]|nr:hypothetical protein HYQ46_006166 [Verticillium longisporum]